MNYKPGYANKYLWVSNDLSRQIITALLSVQPYSKGRESKHTIANNVI